MIRRFELRDLPAPRRGIVMLKLVLVIGLMICSVALVVDIGLLIQRQQQLKTTADAAALAGVATLVDGITRPFPDADGALNDPSSVSGPEDFNPATQESCPARVRLEAARFARANPVGWHAVRLTGNRADGTVTLGWVEHAHVGPDYSFQSPPAGPFNAVRVRTYLPASRWMSPTLVLSQLVGGQLPLRCTSVAVFDQRLIALQPVGCTKVPMLPLVIVCRPGQRNGSPWTNFGKTPDSPNDNEHDENADDSESDGASPSLCPGFSPPEQIVEVDLGGKPAWTPQGGPNGSLPPGVLCALILAFGSDGALEIFEDQITDGLGMEDLVEFGGALSANSTTGLTIGVRNDLLPAQIQAVATALSGVVGQTRILALGEAVGDASAQVLDFVAATVLDVQVQGKNIQLSLRPTRLHTATAVVMEGALRNPWIGKIVLVR